MKIPIALPALFLAAFMVQGQVNVSTRDWNDIAKEKLPPGSSTEVIDGQTVLKIQNTSDAGLVVPLASWERPGVTGMIYSVSGEIQYQDVQGDGCLELLNYFASENPSQKETSYFSRTLAASGPLGKLTGSSKWREFTMPFDRTGVSNPPIRLALDLKLPGKGTVYFRPLTLRDHTGAKSLAAVLYPGAWWSDRTAGLIGGIGGSVIGCVAGLLAWLAQRGKARAFVLAFYWAMTAIGAALAIATVVAFARDQPYAVWFPLLLGAVLLLSISPYRLRWYTKLYAEMELRRMSSLDAMKA